MTKHILRIVVTIVILGVVGLCLWLFVFKPSDSETAFSVLENMDNYKGNIAYDETLNIIKAFNNTNCYTEQTLVERDRIFGNADREVGGGEKAFYNRYNYEKVTESLDEIYNIYSSYVLLAQNVSKKELKNIRNNVNDYKSAISKVVDRANAVIEYEKICVRASDSERESLKGELANRYSVLKDAYKEAFRSYYRLIVILQETVKNRTFDGQFVYDAHTSYLDVMLLLDSSLIEVPSDVAENIKNDGVNKKNLTEEQTALKKACIALETYKERGEKGNFAWVDGVTQTDVSSFLNAYVDIISNYQSQLILVANYKFSFDAINALGSDNLNVGVENYKASNVNINAVPSIKTILEFCRIIDSTAKEEAA